MSRQARSRRWLLVPVLLAGLLSAPSLAQPPASPPSAHPKPQGTFRETLQVREVLLEAVVTDHRGRPFPGLSKEDFEVEENGKPVEVVSATYHLRAEETPGPGDLENLPASREPIRVAVDQGKSPRYFILFFHDIRRGDKETLGVLSQQFRAGRGARRWVEEELGPEDYVAVVGYDFKLRLHQDFTNDHEAILEAIDQAVSRGRPEELGTSAPEVPSLFASLPRGARLRDGSRDVKEALRTLAGAARHLPGRKFLFFFSIGLGLRGPERGLLDHDFRATTVEVLNSTDIAVYSFDLTPPNADHALSGSMNHLAESTGGRYYQHVESFSKPLEEVTRQLSGYYLLAYRTDLPPNAAGFRSIHVRVLQPGLRVDYRKGYLVGKAARP